MTDNLLFPSPELLALTGQIGNRLRSLGVCMVTAESCTGGMIAATCTELPGSSDWTRGGIVAYANEMKSSLLAVPETMLERYGAVSEQVVEKMALGALARCDAQAAVAVSGVAGPGGGSVEKPVGTVWIAASLLELPGRYRLNEEALRQEQPEIAVTRTEEGRVFTLARRHLFPGDRAAIRRATVFEALSALEFLLRHAQGEREGSR